MTYVLDYCDYAAKFDEVVEQDGEMNFNYSKSPDQSFKPFPITTSINFNKKIATDYSFTMYS